MVSLATGQAAAHPRVRLRALDTLWFQVGGTVCNLACTHCLVSASPTNRTHDMMSLEAVRPFLAEGARLGVKEYYFTGGEPFLNPAMEEILRETLELGPATVLTNGLLLDRQRCERLAELARSSEYSLDLRISIDGPDPESNDRIRGDGTFVRVLRVVKRLADVGIPPVLTVTEAWNEASSEAGRRKLFSLLVEAGVSKPRVKVLPLFRIGQEAQRSGSYEGWQRLSGDETPDGGWEHLQCSSCRMVTSRGVWVCPILVNQPAGRMGEALADTLRPFALSYAACWTCHARGATCRT